MLLSIYRLHEWYAITNVISVIRDKKKSYEKMTNATNVVREDMHATSAVTQQLSPLP